MYMLALEGASTLPDKAISAFSLPVGCPKKPKCEESLMVARHHGIRLRCPTGGTTATGVLQSLRTQAPAATRTTEGGEIYHQT